MTTITARTMEDENGINEIQNKLDRTNFEEIKIDDLGKLLNSPAVTEGSDISCKTIEYVQSQRAQKYIQQNYDNENTSNTTANISSSSGLCLSKKEEEELENEVNEISMRKAAEFQQEQIENDHIVLSHGQNLKNEHERERESLESQDSDDEDTLFETCEKQNLTSPPALGIPMMSYAHRHSQLNGTTINEEIKYGNENSNSRDSLLPNSNSRDSLVTEENTLSPLLKAVRSGDLKTVLALLNLPTTDVLRRDPIHGQCALHFAVRGGHLNILQALCNPDIISSMINMPDNRRNIALHLAAAKSRRMTKLLLENKSTIDFINCNNQTPLLIHVLATKRDDPIIAEMLLHYKANPNVAHNEKSTVLHVAIDRSLYHIACRLIKYGARLDALDENGKFVFEKVDKKTLRRLLCHIQFPPVWIPNKARKLCMLCSSKFGISVRRHHCRHCGRLCCNSCTSYQLELVNFPVGFKNRLKNGTQASHKLVRVCKTCYGIMQERIKHAEEQELRDSQGNLQRLKKLRKKKNAFQTFYQRVMHIEYDECSAQSNSPVTGLSRM